MFWWSLWMQTFSELAGDLLCNLTINELHHVQSKLKKKKFENFSKSLNKFWIISTETLLKSQNMKRCEILLLPIKKYKFSSKSVLPWIAQLVELLG